MKDLEVLIKRRSIRSYLNEEVKDDLIKTILNYGILAPSAHNKQPWYFIVVKDQKLITEITDLMINSATLGGKENLGIINTAKIMKEAPALILVFNKFKEEHLIDNTLSIGACIQNILLAATYYNLGSLWIRHTYLIETEIEKMFNKKNMRLSSVIALGYTDKWPSSRPRLTLDEILEMRN